MRTSLTLGTIGGIRIEVNFSWLIIFVLLTFSLAVGWFPATAPGVGVVYYWLTAAIAVILLFASVLAHELAHSFVARSRGMPVKNITLFIFGGVSNIEREPQSPGVEFQMAFVGPLTSLVIGGVFMLIALLVRDITGVPTLLTALLSYMGIVNLLLGVFNLIPGFPMDGGRVLRSIIWKATGSLATATRWATNIGQAIAYLMILGGIFLFFTGNVLDGIWIGFIGLFLLQASQAEQMRSQLESSVAGVTVGEAMTPAPIAVTPELSAQRFVDEYLLQSGQRAIPVIDNTESQRLLGLATLRDVRQTPRELWATTPIGQIMTPRAQLKTVEATQLLSDALPVITEAGVNQLPVVSEGRLVGMLSLEAIMQRVQMRQALGMDTGSAARPSRPSGTTTPGAPRASGAPSDTTNLPTPV